MCSKGNVWCNNNNYNRSVGKSYGSWWWSHLTSQGSLVWLWLKWEKDYTTHYNEFHWCVCYHNTFLLQTWLHEVEGKPPPDPPNRYLTPAAASPARNASFSSITNSKNSPTPVRKAPDKPPLQKGSSVSTIFCVCMCMHARVCVYLWDCEKPMNNPVKIVEPFIFIIVEILILSLLS